MIDIGFDIHIGDFVKTTGGKVGYITDICKCSQCERRGFYEPSVMYLDGSKDYVTNYEAENGFKNYEQIGIHKFARENNEKLQPIIKTYDAINKGNIITKFDKIEFPNTTEIIEKINEMINYLNKEIEDIESKKRATDRNE